MIVRIFLDSLFTKLGLIWQTAHTIPTVTMRVFSHQRKLIVFHWSLSYSKSPQVSRTLLNILADLNNAVVWMVSTSPLISKSSSTFTNSLVTVQRSLNFTVLRVFTPAFFTGVWVIASLLKSLVVFSVLLLSLSFLEDPPQYSGRS